MSYLALRLLHCLAHFLWSRTACSYVAVCATAVCRLWVVRYLSVELLIETADALGNPEHLNDSLLQPLFLITL